MANRGMDLREIWKKHWVVLTTVAFLVFIIIVPFFLTRTWGPKCLKFTESTGWIGDTLGGITAPFIGFVNIVLLIWTLHKQIEFNGKQIKAQKDEQFKAAFSRCFKHSMNCYMK